MNMIISFPVEKTEIAILFPNTLLPKVILLFILEI